MSRILKVAQREYIETVKTKTFIISVLMAPLIVAGIVFFAGRISRGKAGPRPPMKVAVSGLSGELLDEVKACFDEYNKSNPSRQIQLEMIDLDHPDPDELSKKQKDRLRRGRLDMYIVLGKDIVEGTGKIRLYTHSTKASDLDLVWKIESLFNRAVVNRRCDLHEISRDELAKLRRHVSIEHIQVGTADGAERVKRDKERIIDMMVPFFFMYLMFFGIFGNGQQMLTSIIEEKSSRVIEVLLSAVSPFQLMAGKILGLTGIGLTVVGLWTVAAYAAAQWKGVNIDVTPVLLSYFVLYYILGFVFFSSILAGIGSICNTLKDAQSLMMPITLIFVLPLISWFKLVHNPQGIFARVLSFLPPLTPMVMVLRLSASSDVRIVEVLASMLLLVVSVLGAIWLAAKIFRTGILMYGKRPRLREVFRWLTQS